MTASGMALPNEDRAEIERRINALDRQLNPQNELADLFLRRFAFLSVRLERCERYDIAMRSRSNRLAEAAYDEEMIAEINDLISKIHQDPPEIVRRLRATPDGLQCLGQNLVDLKAKLEDETQDLWQHSNNSDLADLMGLPTGPSRFNRILILGQAVGGFFDNAPASEWAGLSDLEKIKAARTELLAIIDAEFAHLKRLNAELKHDVFAEDRAGAEDRALFDGSKDAVLARKYEAATERSLYRALREFKAANNMAVEPDPDGLLDDAVDLVMPPQDAIEVPEAPEVTSRGRGSVASFFQTKLAPPEIEVARPNFPEPVDVDPAQDRPIDRPIARVADFSPGNE